jgi:hypothetical protein
MTFATYEGLPADGYLRLAGGGAKVVRGEEKAGAELPIKPRGSPPDDRKMMATSLCESCENVREVRTARSRFLLCELSFADPDFRKYPPQPVVRCDGYRRKDGGNPEDAGAAADRASGPPP